MANVITVTALNRYVKTLLERDSVLTDVALRGEISNFTNHYKTGHFYFSLKDEQCSVKAVMFRRDAQNLAFMPQNGMRVIVRCRISLFERDGAFPVSYTHLDVYKRQAGNRFGCCQSGGCPAAPAVPDAGPLAGRGCRAAAAVSQAAFRAARCM